MELQALVENELHISSNSFSARKGFAWLRVLRKSKKLRMKLVEAHSKLPRSLIQLQSHRIRWELRDISLVQNQLQDCMAKLESQATSTNQFMNQIRQFQEEQSRVQEDMHDTLQLLPRVFSLLEEDRKPCNLPMVSISNSQIAGSSALPSEDFYNYLVLQTSAAALTYKSIVARGQYNLTRSCEPPCRCKCHIEQRMSSPSSVATLVGQIFIGYKALPSLRTTCTDHLCKSGRNTYINISYFFPHWWVQQKVMILNAYYQASTGLGIALSVPRVVTNDSQIFFYVELGNIETIRDMFARGLASPKDIGDKRGETLLHVRS